MVRVKVDLGKQSKTQLIIPNWPGIIKPGEYKIGTMLGYITDKAILELSYDLVPFEVIFQTTIVGLGQSTCVEIGGDALNGMKEKFLADPQTEGVILNLNYLLLLMFRAS